MQKKHNNKSWFSICPKRHIGALFFAFSIMAFYILRDVDGFAQIFTNKITFPILRGLGTFCNVFAFSVSSVLIIAFAAAVFIYIIITICKLFQKTEKLKTAYKACVTLITLVLFIFSGYCALWGICYYAPSFKERSAIATAPIMTEQLASVTEYFASLANQYGENVKRNSRGIFSEDKDELFEKSPQIYSKIAEIFPFLDGPELTAKKFVPSKLLSYMGFTGFIFAFTGETNLNTDSPSSHLPFVIAHEIAHQRTVAAEDEANFVAILACILSQDDAYCYSASITAYTYLSNALYKADPEALSKISATLSDGVKNDISNNRTYWAKYDSPISNASQSIYSGFLQSNGQALGMRSYGACVDLLVAYYLPQLLLGGQAS